MNRFAVAMPRTFAEAAGAFSAKGADVSLPVIKAGGMDVLDHLKEGLIEPSMLVNVRRLRLEGATAPISEGAGAGGGGIRIEATATLAEIAASEIVRKKAPALALAAGSAATPQVRNVATAAGNLLQRPRCWYYRHAQFQCLKKGGEVCFAVDGENAYHAIFGGGPCFIVHPSNLAPPLTVCDGVIHVMGGKRTEIPIGGLYHTPDKPDKSGVRSEHNLAAGEIVTHITLSASPASGFYAIKEKQSFDWPVAAASVALKLDGTAIKEARVCAGAVAPVPWPLPAVENALAGVHVDDDAGLRKACAVAGEGAKPLSQNGYKARLLAVAVRRAVLVAAGRKTEVDA